MQKIVLVLAYLAHNGHARRMHTSTKQPQSRAHLPDEVDQPHAEVSVKALAELLKALSPEVAFNPSSPGMSSPARHPALAGSRSAVLDRVSRRQRGLFQPQMVTESARDTLSDKTPTQTQIEEVIALQPMVMFSKSTCPFCMKAKQAFASIEAPMPVVELDSMGPERAAEIQDHLMTLTGARTVPRVFINHKFIGGGTDVLNLLESGELKTLVEEALEEHMGDLEGKEIGEIAKSEEEWKKELEPEVYRILRNRGTEYPGSHEYDQFYPESGYFACAGCNLPLYSADSKFRSNCGWPVFDKCYHSDTIGSHVATRPDGSGSLEIVCPRCSGHLGHVFFDSFTEKNPNGERH